MTDWSKLQSLADDCTGWQNLNHCWIGEEEDVDRDQQDWLVGAEDESGERYPVMTVDTCQYDAPSAAEPLAKFYAAANPSAIQTLIADLRRLEDARATYTARIMDMTRDIVSVGEALGIPGEEQAGGADEFIDAIEQLKQTAPDFALRARVADLLHLLQHAKISCPSIGDAAQAEIAMRELAHMLAEATTPTQQQVAVPDGWRPVPVMPSIEMVEAGYEASLGEPDRSGHSRVIDQYVAMLSAAPEPKPAAQQSAWVEQVMEQAQVFASAWSLVGGPFDTGNGLEQAEEEKERLRALLGSKA